LLKNKVYLAISYHLRLSYFYKIKNNLVGEAILAILTVFYR